MSDNLSEALLGEFVQNSTCKSFLQVRQEGNRQVNRNTLHYNLSMILAIGYRVRSVRGTQFRQWATQMQEQYLIKGFVMDDERVKEIFTMAADYEPSNKENIRFFQTIQNKLHFACTGMTAAELINRHADTCQSELARTFLY